MSFALASNFGLVISAMLVYVLLLDGKFKLHSRGYQVIVGLSFGLFCIISMLVPIEVRQGIIIDAKYPLVGIASCFGGPIAGLLAGIIAGLFRAYLGGLGVYAAVPTLLMTWGLGLYFRKGLQIGTKLPHRLWQFLVFGVSIWLLQLIGNAMFLLFMPIDEVGPLIVDRSIPAMLVYPPMTVLLGLALDFVESRYVLRKAQIEGEARFRQVFEASPQPMAILRSHSFELIQSNPAFRENFGPAFLFAQLSLIKRAWARLATKEVHEFSEDCEFKQGKSNRYLSVLAGVVVIEDEPCLLIHLVDRTRDVLAEQVRQRLLQNLERKNKQMNDLSFALHHDLRTPLVSILAFVGEMRERLTRGDIPGSLDDLGRVEGASQKLSKLVLGISQLNESLKMDSQGAECEFDLLIKSLARRIFPSDVGLHLENCQMILPIEEKRMEGILKPIFENALQFAQKEVPLQVWVSLSTQENEYHIRIQDNGQGIESQYLERMFLLFERLDPKSPGIGLGLTLARRLVESCGGRIWLESNGLGKGTTVHISIPDKEAIFP